MLRVITWISSDGSNTGVNGAGGDMYSGGMRRSIPTPESVPSLANRTLFSSLLLVPQPSLVTQDWHVRSSTSMSDISASIVLYVVVA